jgi:hypothetical protein
MNCIDIGEASEASGLHIIVPWLAQSSASVRLELSSMAFAHRPTFAAQQISERHD